MTSAATQPPTPSNTSSTIFSRDPQAEALLTASNITWTALQAQTISQGKPLAPNVCAYRSKLAQRCSKLGSKVNPSEADQKEWYAAFSALGEWQVSVPEMLKDAGQVVDNF